MWKGSMTKAMLFANRNGNFYVLDRENGRFLSGTPFVKVNWMSGWDEGGRPILTPQPPGMSTYPGNQGGTNWYSPSVQPANGTLLCLGVGKLRIDLSQGDHSVSGRTSASTAAAFR
jgi:alcohol dehydrogenase (cytochrome c)